MFVGGGHDGVGARFRRALRAMVAVGIFDRGVIMEPVVCLGADIHSRGRSLVHFEESDVALLFSADPLALLIEARTSQSGLKCLGE